MAHYNNCIEHGGYKNKDGYGQKRYKGKVWLAHRVAYDEAYGPIPKGMSVCHKCDNPSCINPEHLFLGTHQENVNDMVNKGRLNTVTVRGSKHPTSKLTEDNVLWIRSMEGKILQKKMAEKFSVGVPLISEILNRKRWKHI